MMCSHGWRTTGMEDWDGTRLLYAVRDNKELNLEHQRNTQELIAYRNKKFVWLDLP